MSDASALFESRSYPSATAVFSRQRYAALHLHRHLEFICILSGSVEVTVQGKKSVLSDGASALIAPYTPHSYVPLTEEPQRCVLVFEPECVGTLGEILLKNRPLEPIISGEKMRETFSPLNDTLRETMYSIVRGNVDVLSYVQSYSNLVYFLGKILSLTQLTPNDTAKNKLYLKSVAISNEQYTDPKFDIESVANQLHVSTSRIQQLFSEHMSISFKKYITLLRVNKAKELLRDSTVPIAVVAAASGFNSVRTFNRIFKAHRDISPLEYRKLPNEHA